MLADSIVRKLYTLIAQCQNHMGKANDALAACAEGRRHFPDDVEILSQEAAARRHLGDVAGAIVLWEQVLVVPAGAHFASMNTGLRGFLTRHNLATAYMELNLFDKALSHWQAAVAESPAYLPLRVGLAELAIKRKRWDELEKVIGHLRAQSEAAIDADIFQARLHLGQREFRPAREILATTIAAHPQALWPRAILSHVLLQEGRDWSAAEQALREVLALDPNHSEARQNLSVLLHKMRSQVA